MQQYRIISLDNGGRVETALDITCRDDLDALAEGERIGEESNVEIWQGPRFVARVKQGNMPLGETDPHSL